MEEIGKVREQAILAHVRSALCELRPEKPPQRIISVRMDGPPEDRQIVVQFVTFYGFQTQLVFPLEDFRAACGDLESPRDIATVIMGNVWGRAQQEGTHHWT